MVGVLSYTRMLFLISKTSFHYQFLLYFHKIQVGARSVRKSPPCNQHYKKISLMWAHTKLVYFWTHKQSHRLPFYGRIIALKIPTKVLDDFLYLHKDLCSQLLAGKMADHCVFLQSTTFPLLFTGWDRLQSFLADNSSRIQITSWMFSYRHYLSVTERQKYHTVNLRLPPRGPIVSFAVI